MDVFIKLKGESSSMFFYPELIADCNDVAEIIETLKREVISKVENLGLEDVEIVSIDGSVDMESFWIIFMKFRDQWRACKRKLEALQKDFEGQDHYWYLDEGLLTCKRMKEDTEDFDFRMALASGNCFRTSEEAFLFKDRIFAITAEENSAFPGFLKQITDEEGCALEGYEIEFDNDDKLVVKSGLEEEYQLLENEEDFAGWAVRTRPESIWRLSMLDLYYWNMGRYPGDGPYYPAWIMIEELDGDPEHWWAPIPQLLLHSSDAADNAAERIQKLFGERGCVFDGIAWEHYSLFPQELDL